MFEACQQDQGKVGELFNKAKEQIAYYLDTGESKGFSGHTLMWEAQKDFHLHEEEVRAFVRKHLTQEFCKLDNYVYQHLLEFQHSYVTSPKESYPFQEVFGFNFYEYMNNIEDELTTSQASYKVDMLEQVKDEEYYNRLYFRRRQGWGKSVLSKNNQIT